MPRTLTDNELRELLDTTPLDHRNFPGCDQVDLVLDKVQAADPEPYSYEQLEQLAGRLLDLKYSR